MAATPTQTLFDEAKCYSCAGPVDNAQTMRLAMVRRALLAVVPGADTSPEALEAYATCYICLPGVSQADGFELAMLDQLAQALA